MSDTKREALEALNNSELLILGQYLNLEVKNVMLKFEIRNFIVSYLVDKEIFYEDALDLVKSFGVDSVKMIKIEMQQKIRLKEIEEKLRLKEIEGKRRSEEIQLKRKKCNRKEKRYVDEMQMQLNMNLSLNNIGFPKKKRKQCL